MKTPSSDTNPKTYAISLSHNVQYHQAVGYNGNLALVTFADALVLLANPKVCGLQHAKSLPGLHHQHASCWCKSVSLLVC